MSLSVRYWSRQDDLITRTAEAASVCTGFSVFVYTVALFHNNAILNPMLPTEREVKKEKRELLQNLGFTKDYSPLRTADVIYANASKVITISRREIHQSAAQQ